MIEIKIGIERLLKRLSRIYLNVDVLKYTLPEEITRNKIKAPSQTLVNAIISDFFDFGHEKMMDFDNSMYSFIGC